MSSKDQSKKDQWQNENKNSDKQLDDATGPGKDYLPQAQPKVKKNQFELEKGAIMEEERAEERSNWPEPKRSHSKEELKQPKDCEQIYYSLQGNRSDQKLSQLKAYSREFLGAIQQQNPALFPLLRPIIMVQLVQKDNQKNYYLDEYDVKQLFSKFGTIQKQFMQDSGKIFLLYQDLFSAILAQKSMNHFQIPDIDSMELSVQLCHLEENYIEKFLGDQQPDDVNEYLLLINTEVDLANMNAIMRAYTYCFVITVSIRDEEFQLKDRILGIRAYNLQKIISQLDKLTIKKDIQTNKTESEIKLKLVINTMKKTENQILILSNNYEKLTKAQKQVFELLYLIIDEYKRYCVFVEKKIPDDLYIEKIDKVNYTLNVKFQ